MVDVVHDPEVEVDEEWVVIEPPPSIDTSGKQCVTCNVILPKRRFIYGATSYDECPACRKVRTNREAQARWYAKQQATLRESAAQTEKEKHKLIKSVTSQINRMRAMDLYRLKKMTKLLSEGRGDVRTQRGIAMRQERLAHYQRVLDAALHDINIGKPRPLRYYMDEVL